MSEYTPNWANKAFRKRALKIVLWLETQVGLGEHCLHSQILRTQFGNTQPGRYLQNLLLIKTNPGFKPGKYSQQYRVNQDAAARLAHQLGIPPIRLRHLNILRRFDEQQAQILSGDFEMTLKEYREYNGLQTIPREHKAEMWRSYGYVYDYDIDTCAPTLLLQRAQQIKPSMKPLIYIEQYIKNKTEIRRELEDRYTLSPKQVKQLLNGLFQGGILNFHPEGRLFQIVRRNRRTMYQLRSDTYITNLSEDLKCLWRILRADIPKRYEYRGEQRRLRRITGKDKSNLYMRLENQVMKSVKRYLAKNKIKPFTEHDGFRSREFVIPEDLSRYVRSQTGFVVKFKWENIGESNLRCS